VERGYIKVWRKLEDSGLLQMPNTLALFMFLLMKVTRTERKVGTSTGVVTLRPGQYIGGRKKLAEMLEQGEQQIRTSLERLEAMEILTSSVTSRYSIYTIVNYELYQQNDDKVTSSQPALQPTDNQQVTTKQEINKETISTKVDSALAMLIKNGVSEPLSRDWLKIRKDKRLPLTETALKATIREAESIGFTLEQAITVACENSWAGFKAKYVKNDSQPKPQYQSAADKQREQAQRMFGDLTNGRGREIDVSQDGAEWDRPALPFAIDDLR
jgi:hypothetical protein